MDDTEPEIGRLGIEPGIDPDLDFELEMESELERELDREADKDRITNERLYYELRAQHRRMVGFMGLFGLLIAPLAWAYWQETGSLFAGYTAFGSAVAFTFSTFWLHANQYDGRWRKLAERLDLGGDWPADLKGEMRDRGEL